MATATARHRVALARPIALGPLGLGTDATIPVPGTGTLLIDADTLTVGANTVLRPRDRIAGAGATELVDVKSATPTAGLFGMVVINHPNSAPLAVTGTFWQATQPVSGTFWQATQPVSLAAAVDVSDRVGRLLGHITVDNASLAVTGPLTDTQLRAAAVPVSGTFWQATQPVSGPLTDTQLRASAVPVSGAFFQATQPVSLAAAVDVSDRAGRLVGVVTLGAGTAQIGLAKISDGTDTALVTTGGRLNVQSSYDGLAQVMFTAEAVAGIIAETAITLTLSRAFAATSTGTSFGPTAGKNLRIWGMYVTWVSTTTTANTVRLRLRVNAGGAATTASPLQFSARIGWESPTFIANEAEMQPIMFPNPIEIPSGGQFMLTQACVAANGTVDITLLCDEYTP